MKLSASDRLWHNVNREGPTPEKRPDLGQCWVWEGHTRDTGYARIRTGGRDDPHDYVHRVAYVDQVGPIPEGYEVDHLCRTRNCVRGSHLEAVTIEVHGARRRSLVCGRKIHFMFGRNLINRGRTRGCRACKNERGAVRYREART